MSWRWKLSVLFVLIAGFSTLIFMGHETTNQAPPIPDRVVDSAGAVLFTGSDILAGQGVFHLIPRALLLPLGWGCNALSRCSGPHLADVV